MSRSARSAQRLPEAIEAHRDTSWRRAPELRVESVQDAEHFVEDVGFAWTLTDVRTPGPSLFVAVCGRRDAHLPHNVQKDPEASAAWLLKDELMLRGKVFYGKVLRKRSTLIATRLVPAFHALVRIERRDEAERLSSDARAVLKVLRKEWEMGTADLRAESGVRERAAFTKAMDELQSCMKVIPGEVLYVPKFTYIWHLAEGRFPDELRRKLSRERAVKEIAAAYLSSAGQTARGELATVTGLKRPEAGRANHALVNDAFAERIAEGVYRLASLPV